MSKLTDQCLFCNKANQKIIYSSKLIFVVRDSYPVTKHHTLIIPHRHVSDFFSLNNKELFELDDAGSFKRTSDGNLILKYYPE